MPNTRERTISRKVWSMRSGSRGIARVVQGGRELRGQADALVELPQGQQPGIGRERGIGHLDPNGQRLVEIEVEEGRGLGVLDRSPVSLPVARDATNSTNTDAGSVISGLRFVAFPPTGGYHQDRDLEARPCPPTSRTARRRGLESCPDLLVASAGGWVEPGRPVPFPRLFCVPDGAWSCPRI